MCADCETLRQPHVSGKNDFSPEIRPTPAHTHSPRKHTTPQRHLPQARRYCSRKIAALWQTIITIAICVRSQHREVCRRRVVAGRHGNNAVQFDVFRPKTARKTKRSAPFGVSHAARSICARSVYTCSVRSIGQNDYARKSIVHKRMKRLWGRWSLKHVRNFTTARKSRRMCATDIRIGFILVRLCVCVYFDWHKICTIQSLCGCVSLCHLATDLLRKI